MGEFGLSCPGSEERVGERDSVENRGFGFCGGGFVYEEGLDVFEGGAREGRWFSP